MDTFERVEILDGKKEDGSPNFVFIAYTEDGCIVLADTPTRAGAEFLADSLREYGETVEWAPDRMGYS
ncbi:hypothetical protein [Paroceanicella profunda]|uniref:hypothetical protein n=1 Tax=Paroceanicella profunda TaxID=2579971 RepID=UPI0014787E67|nr:hypothetical protein [Paroceanicella profunda]